MKDVTNKNFGLVIAYLLPGYILLWGLDDVVNYLNLRNPFQSGAGGPNIQVASLTVGGFFHETLMALAAGMILNTVRWAVVDTILHHTGIRRPVWDESKLQANLQAFDMLVEHNYRFYQFHSSTFIGLLVIFVARPSDPWQIDLLFVVVLASLFGASRDALNRYYRRALLLLDEPERNIKMSNGSHTPTDKSTKTHKSALPTKKTAQRGPNPTTAPQDVSAESKGGSDQDRSS